MYIQMTRIRSRHPKMSEAEFNLTRQIMDMLDIVVESDYTLYSGPCDGPLMCGTKELGFSERYSSINNIPKDLAVFRPFKNEKHANIIIELFEESGLIDFDTLEISEYEKDGKTKFSGWLVKDGKTVQGSYIRTSPSAAILKMSILAALLMEAYEHHQYMDNLMSFLKKGGTVNEKNETDTEF